MSMSSGVLFKLASGSKRVELNSVDVVAAREWYTNKAFVVQDSLCLPNCGGFQPHGHGKSGYEARLLQLIPPFPFL